MKNQPTKSIQIALVEEAQTKRFGEPTLVKQYLEQAKQQKNALDNLFEKIYEARTPAPKVSNRSPGM